MALRRSPTLPFFLLFLAVLHSAAGTGNTTYHYQAVVFPVSKDAATALYTFPFNTASRAVLDLAGPRVYSTCSGAVSSSVTVRASPTDGHTVLPAVTATVHSSCAAPRSLLKKLPATATGVAGFGFSALSFPAQLEQQLRFEPKFGLCLPSVAVVGGGPFFLQPPDSPAITDNLQYTKFLRTNGGGYYLNVKGIAVNQKAVPLPRGRLALNAGGVALSTVVQFAALRSDIYRPFIKAFAGATSGIPRAKAAPPFELCYKASALGVTRVGYAVPQIDLMLAGGKNWTVFGANSIVELPGSGSACLAFVESRSKAAPAPAVVIGGFQMENNYLQFDAAKQELGFSSLLFGIRTTCSNFLGFSG